MTSRCRARNHQTVTALIFLCSFVSFFERMAFSIAFTTIAEENGLTETEKGLAMASYYFGFTVSQIPGGYLTKRYGGKNTLGLSFLLWTPLSAVLAASTRSGYAVAVVVSCRLGIGLAQGVFLPAAHSVLGHWTPPACRGRQFALAFSGFFAGAAVAMITVPRTVSRFGAFTTFYVSAVLGAAWLAVWICAGSDAPPRETAAAAAAALDGKGSNPTAQQQEEWEQGAAPCGAAGTRAVSEDDIVAKPGDDHWRAAGLGLKRQHSEDWSFHNPSAGAPWVTENPRLRGSNPSEPEPPPRGCECSCRCAPPGSRPTGADVESRCCVDEGCVCLDCDGRVFADSCGADSGSGLPRPHCGYPACFSGSSGGSKPSGDAYFLGSSWPPGSAVVGGGSAVGTKGPPPEVAAVGAATAAAAMAAAVAARPNGWDDDDPHSTDLCYSSSSSSEGKNGRIEDDVLSADLCYSSSSSGGSSSSSGGEEPEELLYFYVTSHETQVQGGPARSPTRLSPVFPPPANNPATVAPESLDPLDGHVDEGSGRATATISASSVDGRWTVTANGGADGGNNGGGECPGVLYKSTSASSEDHHASKRENGGPADTGATAAGGGAAVGAGAAAKDLGLGVSSRRGHVKYLPFPWKAMGASSAAWACVAGNVGAGIAINVVMSWLPTYYEEFILVDLEDIGVGALLSPYLTMMAFSILGGFAYCFLTNSRGLSRARASKTLAGSAFAVSLGALPSMGLARSSATATLLSSLALAGAALSRGGWSTKHMEIAAPEQAAMLYSVANTICAAASVFGISVTGKLLDSFGGGGEDTAWTAAMGTIGAVSGVCGIVFVAYARGDDVLFPVDVDAAAADAAAAGAAAAAAGKEGGRRGWRWPWGRGEPLDSWPEPFGWNPPEAAV